MPDWLGASFMPHGHCWLWSTPMLVLQVGTNLAIAVSYFAISCTLGWLVHQIRDIPFRAMYAAFGVFIVTCGWTHLLDVWVIWRPDYWVDAGVRLVTAIASVGTAILLPPLIPEAVAIARGAKAAHDRGIELAHVVDDLARSVEKAVELDALKTAFFSNVSHELRTPLALILGPTERLLADGRCSPEVARDLEVIRRNARTLAQRVDELLELARLDAGRTELSYSRCDLAALLRDGVAHYDAFAIERGVRVDLDAPDALPVEIDAARVQRVLLNLLSNAFKFTPEGGTVRASVVEVDGHARIEVADSGPGVPDALREVVFERFHQVGSGDTRPFGGTGLGLSIAKEIVELHGGEIAMSRAPEGGALVTVVLPRRAPPGTVIGASTAPPPRVEAPLPAEPPQPRIAYRGDERPRVLVVEDNPDLATFLSEALSARYDVATAADGAEGLAAIAADPPDLVVTDLMMPNVGGEQLVRGVRASGSTVPVLVLSARADEAVRVDLLGAGADDFVIKPFRLPELTARVDRLIHHKRAYDLLRAELAGQEGTLESLARALAADRRALERANALKTSFLRMITHELRTPVHALALQAELLERQPDRLPTLLQGQRRAIARLREMVDALLLQARVEGGDVRLDHEEVDVAAVVREVVDEARHDAEARPLTFTVDAPAALPVQADRRVLRLIVGNLVGNAAKFTAEGEVRVGARRDGEGVVVSVADTGPGIPEQDRQRIFEPFEQVADSRWKHASGVGLGLSLVRDFVSALGGGVELESEVGRGSTFTVRLPGRRR